jgi:hypothetical protein
LETKTKTMYHIIGAIVVALSIVAAFLTIDEKYFNKNPTGYQLQFAMMAFLLFGLPLILTSGNTMGIKVIKLVSIPALLTFATIQVPSFRRFYSNLLGIDIDENEMSVQDFFRTRFGFVMSISLFLIYFCLNQMIVLPILSSSTLVPDIAQGQILPVDKGDVPRVMFLIVAYIILPLFLSDKLTDFIAKLAANSNAKNIDAYKSAMRIVATLFGFTLSFIATQVITPVEIGGAFAAAALLFMSGAVFELFRILEIKLPKNALNQVFTHDEVALLFATMFGVLILMASFVMPLLPPLASIRQQFIGTNTVQISELGKLLILFWMVPSLTGSAYEQSLIKSSKSASKVRKTNGYALGYIVGYLLTLSGYLFTGKLLQKAISRVTTSASYIPYSMC